MTEQRMRGLSRLESVTGFLRKGARTAASIERLAVVGRRLELPVRAVFAKHDRGRLAGTRIQERVGSVGSESLFDGARQHASIERLIQRVAATAKALRTTARATDSVRNKATSKLPLAMEALARSEGSVGLGKLAQAIVVAPRRSTLAPVENSRLSRVTADLEAGRAMPTGGRAIVAALTASSSHGVVPPPNLSQRMFAEPSSGGRDRNNRSSGAAITIHSSPTVVINGPNPGGDVQRDLLGALRAHREELFDQLRRESERRERAQF